MSISLLTCVTAALTAATVSLTAATSCTVEEYEAVGDRILDVVYRCSDLRTVGDIETCLRFLPVSSGCQQCATESLGGQSTLPSDCWALFDSVMNTDCFLCVLEMSREIDSRCVIDT